MIESEYMSQLMQAWILAKWIARQPLQEMADAQARADTLAPLIDPIGYMNKREAFDQDRKLVQILLHAQRQILVAFPQIAIELEPLKGTTDGHQDEAAKTSSK